MQLRDYQQNDLTSLLDALEELEAEQMFGSVDSNLIVLSAPVSYGKEQPYSEPVLTPNGWSTMGNLKINDFVVGSNGKPTKITGIFEQGIKDVYEVSFLDGSKVKCGLDHLWTISEWKKRQTNGKKTTELVEEVVSLKEMLNKKTSIKKKSLYIKLPEPIEYNNKQNLPIDAYLLGLLLGDGGLSQSGISFTNHNKVLIDIVEELIPESCKIGRNVFRNGAYHINIVHKKQTTEPNELNKILNNLGLKNHLSIEKFIPEIYKTASVRDRMKLLQGLIDTDGYHQKTGTITEYSTSSKQLADDVVDLARSLGIITKCSSRVPTYTNKGLKKNGQRNYRIHLRWTRKYKSISGIKKLDYREKSRCIMVDAEDHLYVTEGYTLTHNTIVLANLAKEIAKFGKKVMLTFSYSVLVQQFIELFEQLDIQFSVIAAGFDKYYNEAEPIQIAMYQTLNSRIDKLQITTDVLLSDEIQTFTNTKTIEILEQKLGYEARVGVTGTPYNAIGYKIPAFKTISSVTSKDMLKLGYTSPLEVYTTKWSENIDLSGVKVNSNGEFSADELSEINGTNSYISNCLKSIEAFGIEGHKTLLFAQNIEQAEQLYAELSKKYYCKLVHSKINKKLNTSVIEAFSKHVPYIEPNNEATLFDDKQEPQIIDMLISVGSLGVGFSVDDIDTAIVTRSTNSLILNEQAWIGRLKRKHNDIPHKRILDMGVNFNRLGGLDDDDLFEPVEQTGDRKTDRENIYKAISKNSKPLLASILPDDLDENRPFKITRKWYDDSLQELKDIEAAIFEEAEQERLAKLAEQKAIRDKLSEEQAKQARELEPLKRMVKVLKTTDSLETMSKAYLWIWIYLNGRPISKQGREYTPDYKFMYDKWMEAVNKYPEMINRWTKAMRTRLLNLLKKDGSKCFSALYFMDFLKEQYEAELDQQNQYNAVSSDDISEDDCPF